MCSVLMLVSNIKNANTKIYVLKNVDQVSFSDLYAY